MRSFIRTCNSECYKILSSRAIWIVFGLIIIIQPLLALLEATQLAPLGLDATPETHPELIEALPSLDYFGIDVLLFGLMPMVIFGGILGASEYRNHQLRTTLLCNNKRSSLFFAKVVAVLITTTIPSFIAIFLTLSFTHIGLAELGLHPLFLSEIAWRFIGYGTLNWVLLTVLSFGIGFVCRNAIIPLAFLVPQVYNLGSYLAQNWQWGKYLPVAAGNLLIATPTDTFAHEPLKSVLILTVWIVLILIIALYSFVHKDVGGKY